MLPDVYQDMVGYSSLKDLNFKQQIKVVLKLSVVSIVSVSNSSLEFNLFGLIQVGRHNLYIPIKHKIFPASILKSSCPLLTYYLDQWPLHDCTTWLNRVGHYN